MMRNVMAQPTPNLAPPGRAILLDQLLALAEQAGDVTWGYFGHDAAVECKPDDSPVTAADREAEALILAGLARVAPGVPVVAEEAVSGGDVPAVGDAFFLVDPLDGTREFIRGGSDYTVNIGLIEGGRPTMGVVYAPARGELYWGDVTTSAWRASRQPLSLRGDSAAIRVRPCDSRPAGLISRTNGNQATEAWLAAAGVIERVAVGSSLKFALIAAGRADVYPRPAPTMEWDTAAGDAVLRAAGGRVLDLDGADLRYGKPGFFNPGFLATGAYCPDPLRPHLDD
ncbi:MAG TPA: 3'(2'),5'-bisphosphate nucleotidase CysQ [Allosphingosinicella sp.]|jgi:3'(2'), 5'-bisphosphate nucleotidase